MRMFSRFPSLLSVAALCVLAAEPLTAQPKTRPLGPIIATSTDTLGVRVAVRALSSGKVLVNDVNRHRVLLFDAALSSSQVMIDSGSNSTNAMMPVSIASAQLIAFTADSTLFVDVATQGLLVLDPNGKVSHVMALPRPRDAMYMAIGAVYGSPAIDPKGRLVYRGVIPPVPARNAPGGPAGFTIPQQPDSSPIVRADFDTRHIDTLTTIKALNPGAMTITPDKEGNMVMKITVNPFDTGDEWAMLTDGTIAVVRAHDYHIDWLDADGTRRSTPKMPFEWKRLTDEAKQVKIDSIRPIMEKQLDQQRASLPQIPTPDGPRKLLPQFEFIPLSKMPDYEPPISPGSVRADLDNNLWIVPRTAMIGGTGGLIYDVVNRNGEITERVQIPKDRALVGFGPDGVVYMVHVKDKTAFLERAKLR